MNRCFNRLMVQGPKEILSAFVKDSTPKNRFFSLKATVDPSKMFGGWTSLKNMDILEMAWGTPKEVFNVRTLFSKDDFFFISFETCSGPPSVWLRNVSSNKKYQDLKFHLAFLRADTPMYGVFSFHQGVPSVLETSLVNKEYLIVDAPKNISKDNLKDNLKDESSKYRLVKQSPFYGFVKQWSFNENEINPILSQKMKESNTFLI